MREVDFWESLFDREFLPLSFFLVEGRIDKELENR